MLVRYFQTETGKKNHFLSPKTRQSKEFALWVNVGYVLRKEENAYTYMILHLVVSHIRMAVWQV
jgi:hypothetical protein